MRSKVRMRPGCGGGGHASASGYGIDWVGCLVSAIDRIACERCHPPMSRWWELRLAKRLRRASSSFTDFFFVSVLTE